MQATIESLRERLKQKESTLTRWIYQKNAIVVPILYFGINALPSSEIFLPRYKELLEQNMQNMKQMQNMQNNQNMQNIQSMQKMQNMHNM